MPWSADVSLRVFFFFSSRRRHTRCSRDWSSDVCSSDLRSIIAADERDLRAQDPTGGVLLVDRQLDRLLLLDAERGGATGEGADYGDGDDPPGKLRPRGSRRQREGEHGQNGQDASAPHRPLPPRRASVTPSNLVKQVTTS